MLEVSFLNKSIEAYSLVFRQPSDTSQEVVPLSPEIAKKRVCKTRTVFRHTASQVSLSLFYHSIPRTDTSRRQHFAHHISGTPGSSAHQGDLAHLDKNSKSFFVGEGMMLDGCMQLSDTGRVPCSGGLEKWMECEWGRLV